MFCRNGIPGERVFFLRGCTECLWHTGLSEHGHKIDIALASRRHFCLCCSERSQKRAVLVFANHLYFVDTL